MRKSLFILLAVLPALSGDYYRSVVIHTPEDKPCCDCDCEYNHEEDVTYYGEDLSKRYTYFGGVPHICVRDYARDEKGIDLSKKHTPHVCRGEWCPKECCFSAEDYFRIKYDREGNLVSGNVRYPVVPTPPPVSPDH